MSAVTAKTNPNPVIISSVYLPFLSFSLGIDLRPLRPLEQALKKLAPPSVEIGSGLDGPSVVIVGGGVIGWSCAYHILKLSPRSLVAVVEELPSSGMRSTGRAAGGVRAQFGTPVNIELSQFSKRAFERFEVELGVDISFRQRGYLFVTATEAGRKYLESVVPLQASMRVGSQIVTPKEISAIASYLNCDDLVCGSWCPDDGYLDPFSVCAGFEKASRRMGAVPLFNTTVSRVGRGVVGFEDSVAADEQEVTADHVVVASGHLTSRLLGDVLPIVPVAHQLALSEGTTELPKELPMVVDLDTSFHFRSEGEGLLIGFDDKLKPVRVEQALENPSFDDSFLSSFADFGLHRLTALEKIEFNPRKCWAGYYAETPDHHSIIGNHNGMIVAAGFGGHGIMHSPAAGQAVAEFVLGGRCVSFDLHPLRPSRFSEGDLTREPMVI